MMDAESLEALNLNYKEYSSFIDTLDKKFHSLKANAGQLAGAYVVFVGVLYIQATIPSAALQRNRWISICLLALVSVVFWPTFITTVNDCMRTRQQQDSAFMEQVKLHRKVHAIRTGRKQNDGSAASAAAQHCWAKAFASVRRQRYAYVGAVHSALLSFNLLVLYALFMIPRF